MDEQIIAEQQRAKVPTTNSADQPAVIELEVNSDRSTVQLEQPIDPMTAYKVANLFGMSYEPSDTELTGRINYIYEKAAEKQGSTDYTQIAEYIKSMISMLGLQSAQNPVYNLYQWLRLDATRQKAEREMNLYANWG